MNFDDFESEAYRMWDEIPSEYKEGIDGIVVKREAEAHPEHDDYYTLGMCFTEPYPSGYMGPDSTRSILTIYYGSFHNLADRSPDFSWEEELWETITHELRHHLEFLAEDDALEGLDYALEESFKRRQGEDFDPWYFQSGISIAPGVYRLEYDIYIEREWRRNGPGLEPRVEFDWHGRRWAIPTPEDLGDIHYVWVPGLETGGGWLQVVLIREIGLWERISRFFFRRTLDLVESEAEPKEIGEAPDAPGPDDGRPGRAAGGPPSRDDGTR